MSEPRLTPDDSRRFLDERTALYRRLLAIAGVALVVALAVVAYLSSRPRYTPYVVAVDSWGIARTLEPLEDLAALDERVLRAEVRRVIQNLRTWTHDVQLLERLNREAAGYLTDEVRAYVEATLPEPGVNDLQREVTVRQILRLQPLVYTVSWDETTFHRGGAPDIESWDAVVRLSETAFPTDEKTLSINPLGLRIVHLDWSLRAEAPGDKT